MPRGDGIDLCEMVMQHSILEDVPNLFCAASRARSSPRDRSLRRFGVQRDELLGIGRKAAGLPVIVEGVFDA
jgi:hypothetical protein